MSDQPTTTAVPNATVSVFPDDIDRLRKWREQTGMTQRAIVRRSLDLFEQSLESGQVNGGTHGREQPAPGRVVSNPTNPS